MLSKQDKDYLQTAHSSLKLSDDERLITGTISFDAVYDNSKSQDPFTIISVGDTGTYTGERFSGSFKISIRLNGFPRLVISENLPKEARRHFYTDSDELVGCVCGPIEEFRFMQNFNLRDYLETLVIPFLYGQLYFDVHQLWPFPAYGHNTVGLLESYYLADGTEFREHFLDKLRLQKADWDVLEPILYGQNKPRGHMQCFCPKHDFIRRCHPDAWEGVKKLYFDLHNKSKEQ